MNQRKKPTQRRSQERVETILQVSKQIIEKEGLKKFNTNYIAKLSGLSVGSIYQYFQSKEGILQSLFKRETKIQLTQISERLEALSKVDLEEKLKVVIDTYIGFNDFYQKLINAENVFGKKVFDQNKFVIEQKLLQETVEFIKNSVEKSSKEVEKTLIIFMNSLKNSPEASSIENLKDALLSVGLKYLAVP